MNPIRVLVIDDNEEICRLVTERLLLDAPGEFSVTTASGNLERFCLPGIWLAVDCLVLDLWLTPDGINEGYPLARKILDCARAERPDLDVVAFSAVAGMHHEPVIEAEVDVVLSKPSIERLAPTILALARRRRQTDRE